MANYELLFNGQQLDYEDAGGLSLVIEKKIDDMRNFAGSFGGFASNISNTLEIPSTQNNRRVFFNPHDVSARNFDIYTKLGELKILVGGTEVFSGQARVIAYTYTKTATYGGTITLEVNPTATNLFSLLDTAMINKLDLGQHGSTEADIDASQTDLSVTDNPVIFFPVNYGGSPFPNSQTELVFNLYDDPIGARPSIRVHSVLRKIADTLGYRIISNYIETPAFLNKAHPFVVGKNWERADNWQDYRAEAEAVNFSASTGNAVIFGNIISDPMNLIAARWFIAQVGGYYEFEIKVVGSSGTFDVVVEEWDGATFRRSKIIATANNGQEVKIKPIDFYNGYYKSRLAVRFNSATPTYTVSGFIRVRLTKQAILGEPFKIASCLPEITAKDYLIALRHLFGWVVAVNETLKQIYIEPRFLRPLPETISASAGDPSQGYYDLTAQPQDLKVDIEQIVAQRDTVFGNKLLIAMAENTENVGIKYYQNALNGSNSPQFGSQIQDPYAVELILSDTAQEPTEQKNPLFAAITNYKVQLFYSEFSNKVQFPLICEDEALLDINTVSPTLAPVILPTYEGKFCIVQYYGVLDFEGIPNYYYVRHSYTAFEQKRQIPSAFQVYPNDENYLFKLSGLQPYNVVFATLNYTAGSFGKVYGMFDRYYSKYAALIYKATYITFNYLPSLSEFVGNMFRKPVKISINGESYVGWLIEINNYSPLESRFARATMIVDHEITDFGNSYDIKINTDKPILSVAQFLSITEDQP